MNDTIHVLEDPASDDFAHRSALNRPAWEHNHYIHAIVASRATRPQVTLADAALFALNDQEHIGKAALGSPLGRAGGR
ncbi:MAG TPA: hypothetical protein VHO67_13815 [Polyangia bacterium]|nr:hypothetical protein [Polyangia bacterium]